MTEPDWIVHDEKRMHLPELSDVCVTCLQGRVADLERRLRGCRRALLKWMLPDRKVI